MCNNKEKTLWKFLQNNTVEIPIIQRDYAQGRIGKEKLREIFLKDLKEALDDKEKTLKLDFIYGSTENGIFQPLDGQQRLTTLWLLHWYIAYKAGKLSGVKKTLGNFTYETRVSSREFCKKILELPANDEEKVVEHIKKQTWFYSEWLQDPTIQAMLNMIGGTSVKSNKNEEIIDGLEEVFDDNVTVDEYKKYWELLIGNECPIQFYSLELTDFGLTDDLYIKMNVRGKLLTSFENFKADFINYIKTKEWENNKELTDTFAYKIDTVWTDLFWKYKSENNKIDDAFFNFFARYFLNYLIVNKEDSEKEIKEDPLYKELYRSENDKEKIEYNSFKNYKTIFDKGCLKRLTKTLDNIAKHQSLFECIAPQWEDSKDKNPYYYPIPQYKEKDEIKEITDDGRVIFFAICRFFELINEQGEEKLKETLKQWMRVVWNIVENSDPNLVGKLRLIRELSEHSHSIYDFLADDNVIKSNFATEQIKEERLKTKLILLKDTKWEDQIKKIEQHPYFNGQIGFVLKFSKTENGYDINKFSDYSKKMKLLFSERFENKELFQRGLLTFGNYLAPISTHYTFCNFDEGLEAKKDNWRKVFNDDTRSGYLKNLLDELGEVDTNSIENNLKEIIGNFKQDENDWKSLFIKNEGIIKSCGNYQIDTCDNDIYLARSPAQWWRKKAELRTYVFYKIKLSGEACKFSLFKRTWYYDSKENPCAVIDEWHYKNKYNFALNIYYSNNIWELKFFDRNENDLPSEIQQRLVQNDNSVKKSYSYEVQGVNFDEVEKKMKEILENLNKLVTVH